MLWITLRQIQKIVLLDIGKNRSPFARVTYQKLAIIIGIIHPSHVEIIITGVSWTQATKNYTSGYPSKKYIMR